MVKLTKLWLSEFDNVRITESQLCCEISVGDRQRKYAVAIKPVHDSADIADALTTLADLIRRDPSLKDKS